MLAISAGCLKEAYEAGCPMAFGTDSCPGMDQYEKGISHEEAGAILAEEILTDCGYTREERKFMTDTILRHRDMKEESESFASIFYRADKLSRDCIHCKARQECYWPEEKKNNKYIY